MCDFQKVSFYVYGKKLSILMFSPLQKYYVKDNIFQGKTELLYITHLVNIKDWCKNEFEVISQLRINTENSNQRFDIIVLINGLPVVQIELKKLDISPRKAMQQIVDYKNEPGNGYGNHFNVFHAVVHCE